jgi:hypothetical protein
MVTVCSVWNSYKSRVFIEKLPSILRWNLTTVKLKDSDTETSEISDEDD